jgi:hypothetical protein
MDIVLFPPYQQARLPPGFPFREKRGDIPVKPSSKGIKPIIYE